MPFATVENYLVLAKPPAVPTFRPKTKVVAIGRSGKRAETTF
jgi:hypothetical protein